MSPVSASTSSNGADWHLGVLELPRDGYADTDEDLYFSGVYIETGEITTNVSGQGGKSINLILHDRRPVGMTVVSPRGSSGGGSSSSSSSSAAASTTTLSRSSTTLATSTVPTTSQASGSSTSSSAAASSTCAASLYAQCGGVGWSGCTVCASGSTCKYTNDYYSQCL